MGITIHFEGKLSDPKSLSRILDDARSYATAHHWPFEGIAEEVRSLSRVRTEENWDYVGLTSGIEIQPHESCEPLRLEFDSDGFIQEYVKTQFAPIKIHVAIVELLRELKPSFSNLVVVDESDFWESDDVQSLEANFARFFEVVEEAKAENPRLHGPFRLENGRIADLLESEES